eukprot:6399275-Pyramimonas_sp.AAC.1
MAKDCTPWRHLLGAPRGVSRAPLGQVSAPLGLRPGLSAPLGPSSGPVGAPCEGLLNVWAPSWSPLGGLLKSNVCS